VLARFTPSLWLRRNARSTFETLPQQRQIQADSTGGMALHSLINGNKMPASLEKFSGEGARDREDFGQFIFAGEGKRTPVERRRF